MSYLIFPGRHLLNTVFQEAYLKSILGREIGSLPGLVKSGAMPSDPVTHVVYAVTSCNQANSRYNPVPFHLRAIGLDRFARSIHQESRFSLFGIPHYGHTGSFAEFTLKEIRDQSEGLLDLHPGNSLVLCSTPEVIALYQKLGFAILTAEQTEAGAPTPIDLIRELGRVGEDWKNSDLLLNHLSPAAKSLWQDFPEVVRRTVRLYQDPLTNQDGSLTLTRNYSSYARGMNEIIRLKYLDIRHGIRPGRIADEGCADGALLAEIAQDFPDSDFYGIDLSAEFAHRFQERQRSGDFGGAYVHFYQRNLLQPLFEPGSIDTVICNSTLHELWSYGNREETVLAYLREKWKQLRPGGRLLIRDVVGPENGAREICLQCSREDGTNLSAEEVDVLESRDVKVLNGLSTRTRFDLFIRDFLKSRPERQNELCQWRPGSSPGEVILSLRLAAEFCSKKDYTDNWSSEMNEEFCFWSFTDWKRNLGACGFRILEGGLGEGPGSREYCNPWIVEHRWKPSLRITGPDGTDLGYPPTNMVLVAEKPLES